MFLVHRFAFSISHVLACLVVVLFIVSRKMTFIAPLGCLKYISRDDFRAPCRWFNLSISEHLLFILPCKVIIQSLRFVHDFIPIDSDIFWWTCLCVKSWRVFRTLQKRWPSHAIRDSQSSHGYGFFVWHVCLFARLSLAGRMLAIMWTHGCILLTSTHHAGQVLAYERSCRIFLVRICEVLSTQGRIK